MVRLRITVSAGDLIDRLTILELKRRRLPEAIRPEIEREIAALARVRERAITQSPRLLQLGERLAALNAELWDIEEALRRHERAGAFGEPFVALARRVYQANDERAAVKRSIDELVGSEVREHKSHVLPTL